MVFRLSLDMGLCFHGWTGPFRPAAFLSAVETDFSSLECHNPHPIGLFIPDDTMPAIVLRTARPQDRDTVVELIHQLNVFEAGLVGDRRRDYRGAEAYYDELMMRLTRRNGRVILAEEGRIVVGAMGFSLDQDAAYVADEVRNHGTVTDLIVHVEWRSRGIGQMLLNEAERLTREAGLKRLMIGALVANERAVRTYTRFGFEPYVSFLKKEL